jgi:hypothetical protein
MTRNDPLSELNYSTRHKRRNAVKQIWSSLSLIRDAEQKNLDNTPENFQS